jgi:hypothetical protein
MRRWTIFSSLGLLVVAVGLVIYGTTHIPEARFTSRLNDLLPPAPSGWSMKEKPIADSEELKQAVGEILNFDDGVFVDYTNASGERLSVYIAYWTPGKMSHRLIAVHTPDVCWVQAGWVKKTGGPTPDFKAPLVNVKTNTEFQLPRGENRVFSANGVTEYVWFWHIVGSESKTYGNEGTPPWHSAINDLFSKGLHQREEQLFLRISSNKPIDSFMSGEILPALLAAFPWPQQLLHNRP